MNTKEDFKAKKEQLKALREVVKQTATAYFKEEAAGLFETYPDLEEFSWQQYTPYFNDGDQCEFSAQIDYPEINGEEVSTTRYNRKTGKSEPVVQAEWIPKAYTAVKEFLKGFEESDLEEMFGDHATVVVTKESVDVEECEHE